MRKRTKARKRRPRVDPPDGFWPEITEPEPMPLSQDRTVPSQVKKLIVRKINEAEEELLDPQSELLDIELKIAKIRYTAAIGRWKVTQRHSLKEYVV